MNTLQNVMFKIEPEKAYFERASRSLVDKGWSIYPQTIERRPALIGGRSIQPFDEHSLDKRLPYKTEIDYWIKHCPDHNVACVLGDGSGRACAIDIDVTDEPLAEQITQIALDIFGDTPLKRVGRAPKIALIYRSPDEGDLIKNRAIRAVDGGHGIDILSRGKTLTFYGTHHKTGRPYAWINSSPLNLSPQDLPVITREQVKIFLEAVAEIMPLSSSNFDGRRDVDGRVQPADWQANQAGSEDHFGDLNSARLAYRAHAVKAVELSDKKGQNLNQIQILQRTVHRMIITGWPRDVIKTAAKSESNQDPSQYTSNVDSTVDRAFDEPDQQQVIVDLMNDSPFFKKNAIDLEIKVGARPPAAAHDFSMPPPEQRRGPSIFRNFGQPKPKVEPTEETDVESPKL